MSNRFEAALAKGVVVFDGAMGTTLLAKGLMKGLCPEEINLTHPEEIKAIHRAYVEAGSDAIETNSFGGTRIKLAKSGFGDRVEELNVLAAQLARQAGGDQVIVAGSVGPIGEFLEPVGDISVDEAVASFKEQMQALAKGGVDVILIETMSDLGETKAALRAAREATDLPVICTMTFETNFRTMTGVTAAKAAQSLKEYGAGIIGVNCGFGPKEMETILREMKEAYPEATLMAQPNAGIPQLEGDRVVYPSSPEEMAEYARRYVQLGVKIVGACCGSTPDHIRAIADAVREH